MADYTVTIGAAKAKILKYYYHTVDDAIDDIINKQIRRMARSVIEKETEYRGNLSEARKAEIIAAIQDLPTYQDRLDARDADPDL
jgi:hypothetical protein